MTVDQKISPAKIWLKQMTTTTFCNLNRNLDRIEFLKRNKKSLFILFVFWIIINIAGLYILNSTSSNDQQKAITFGVTTANRLADQSGTALLEDDVLDLNRIVSEYAKNYGAVFATVLNHEQRIKAHSEPEKINQMYEPLEGQVRLESIDSVIISSGELASGSAIVVFYKDITFSSVAIGSAVVGVPYDSVFGTVSRYRFFKVLMMMVSTAGFVLGGFLTDLSRKKSLSEQSSMPMTISSDGNQIGPYRLREKIAQGGMAELFLSDYLRDDGFRRVVVVKKVLPNLAENQDFIKMFIREARLAALLQHPNIVQIYDFGKIQNVYFISMEFIDGLNLGQIMAHLQTGLPIQMAIFIITKISLGLDYSHKRKDDETGKLLGIVHRDISPQNILISYRGEVKISDYGISKANTEPNLTQAGVIKGKLSYLSPEQALGKQADHQADIYALGLVFYEILSGSRLYHFETDIEAIRSIPEMDIVPLKKVRNDVPDALNDIVMKCLEKDKKLRYLDAMMLHDDLVKLKSRLQSPYDESNLSTYLRTTFDHE
ncbi:MAG: serine/threonine protein kinase [Desulfobacteraceae bacterium]|nr:serine/threonine protein kinase [Desulfobacteraceae bacterium]